MTPDQQRDAVLLYLRNHAPINPYFTLSAAPIKAALGISDGELAAVMVAMHERRMLALTTDGLRLSDIGETEAARIEAGSTAPPQHHAY